MPGKAAGNWPHRLVAAVRRSLVVSTSMSGRSIAGWAAVLVAGLALLDWSAFVDADDLDKCRARLGGA